MSPLNSTIESADEMLHSIETTVDAGKAEFIAHENADQYRWEIIDGRLKKIEMVLFGDGNGRPGLLIKLDRLNTSMEDLKKLGWMILGSMIVAVLGLLINTILHAYK